MSATVNKPMNKELKDANVEKKLQLYGIVSAFRNGKLPSNEQIDVAINGLLGSKSFSDPSDELSEDGKAIVQDVKDVIRQAQRLLLSKNQGNLLQDFIWQTTTHLDAKSKENKSQGNDAQTGLPDDDALQGLKVLGTLVISNGQFRKLLKDSTFLLRDIAGDASDKATDKLRPSDEQRAQMDKPADDHTWHDTPDFSRSNLKEQGQRLADSGPAQDAKDVAAVGQDASNADRTTDVRNVDAEAGRDAVKKTADKKLNKNVDGDTKDNVKKGGEAYRRRAAEYFKKKMPEDRRDQIVFRFKKMILECQQHQDYSQAIQSLLRLAEQYGKRAREHAGGSAASARQEEASSGISAAEADLRTLVERFANGTSTAGLWEAIDQIYKDAANDDELKGWFEKMDSYIRRCLLEDGYILDDRSSEEWDQLYDQGHYLLHEKYRGHTDRITDEGNFIIDQMSQDPQNQALSDSLQKLFRGIGKEDGRAVIKPHLFKDVIGVILPSMFLSMAYVPVPRIEYSDSEYDIIIENLVIESDNFMPNKAELSNKHGFQRGRGNDTKMKNSIEVEMAGIQMDLHDVSYHVKRKQGFPSITDTGVANILVPNDGFACALRLHSEVNQDGQNYFKIENVDVKVTDLQIKLVQSNHKVLFNVFKPLMLKVLRPPIQRAMESAVKDQCNQLVSLLNSVNSEAQSGLQEILNDPDQAMDIFQRYLDAALKRLLQGLQQARNMATDTKINVAMDKEDSMFPKIHLPGGISSKATEYRELARTGDKWESKVFSLGEADKSTDIPEPPKIERKEHQTSGNSATNADYPVRTNGAVNNRID